jgi:hypothetical protein
MEATMRKTTKYPKVKFNVNRIVKLYKEGKNVSQIAQAVGYPKGTGQNRTRAALVFAGVYKKEAK